jgi:PRTRC genetic system protein E
MFQQLVPLLRQRSVLLTITSLEEDQIRVNVLPKKLADGENAALITPMSFTGTAAELDAQLPDAIVSFVASHLELKNTLDRAKEEMAAAAKAAQDEARTNRRRQKRLRQLQRRCRKTSRQRKSRLSRLAFSICLLEQARAPLLIPIRTKKPRFWAKSNRMRKRRKRMRPLSLRSSH